MLDQLLPSSDPLRSASHHMLMSSSNHHHHFVGAPIDVSPSSILKSVIKKQICNAPIINVSNKRRNRRGSVQWGSIKSYDSPISQDDISRMWYNQQDLKAFKEERRKVVQAIKNARGNLIALEGTKYITRGFECYQSIKFNRTIREQRKVVIESVLRLQHKQRLSCVENPEQIAFVCSRNSSWARSWATDLGMKDSIATQQGYSVIAINKASSLDSFGKRLVKE